MIVAVSMVKDELDVIAGMIAHLIDEGVDRVIVADNGSTDGTRDVLADLQRRYPVTVLDDPEPAYYQSRKMTYLAEFAARFDGATWIVPVDADELWTAPNHLAQHLRELPDNVTESRASTYTFSPTGLDDDTERDPFRRITWRHPSPLELRKVAFRWQPGAVIAQGNHSVALPQRGFIDESLTMWHYPYRSVDQFVSKVRNGAAAYAATDLPESEGQHWRDYGRLLDSGGPAAIEDVFRTWFWFEDPVASGLVHQPDVYRRWRPALR